MKPAGEFYRYTYSKDGLYQQCKACHTLAGENRLAKLAGGEETPVPLERKVLSLDLCAVWSRPAYRWPACPDMRRQASV